MHCKTSNPRSWFARSVQHKVLVRVSKIATFMVQRTSTSSAVSAVRLHFGSATETHIIVTHAICELAAMTKSLVLVKTKQRVVH